MHSVRPLDPSRDAERLPRLFRAFEAKAYQQRIQGLDADKLAAFLARGALESAKTNPAWVAESADSRLTGLAALQTKHWHSEQAGFPVGKVTQLMSAPGADDALLPLLDVLEACARDHGLRHLAVRVDGHAFRAQEILCARGWYPVGTSVKLSARLASDALRAASSDQRTIVRPHRPQDRTRILEIAASAHNEGHLHFDLHLPLGAAHAIFRRWVEKCLDGLAAQIWVCESPITDHGSGVIGFCTVLDPKALNAALATRIAVLDFIVLDRAAQGRGIGSEFLLAVHRGVAAAGFDQIELRTTATNFPALNLYTRHGYRQIGCDQAFARLLA